MAVIVSKSSEPVTTYPGRKRVFLANEKITRSKHLAADVVSYEPGAENHDHFHNSESFIYIIEGDCEVFINGKSQLVGPETMIFLEPGDRHWMRNVGKTEMKMIEAFAPNADSKSFDPSGKPLH